MARVSSTWIVVVAAGFGLAIGVVLDRQGPSLTAQVSAPRAGGAPPAEDRSSRIASDDDAYRELDAQYAMFAQIDRTFALVSRAVAPSVVHIVARKPGSPSARRREPRMVEETGSGVIVRPQGSFSLCVLTNHHVVQSAVPEDIAVTLHDGRVVRPTRAWSDPKADIAVLELGRNDLPAARLGNSDQATVGTWVLALGSPFGLTHSISHGIISARNRHEQDLENEGVENQEFLQTDAAINPGNSGGPLVNMRGEVIGINTAIASSGGGSEGVGFSIPINLAKWIMNELVANGRVNRGALGVRLQDVHAQRAVELGLERPRGARILSVQQDSPAAQAGIRDGDVVIRFNGIEVLDINHFINLVSMSPIGQSVDMEVWRDRRSFATRVMIGSRESLLTAGEVPLPSGTLMETTRSTPPPDPAIPPLAPPRNNGPTSGRELRP